MKKSPSPAIAEPIPSPPRVEEQTMTGVQLVAQGSGELQQQLVTAPETEERPSSIQKEPQQQQQELGDASMPFAAWLQLEEAEIRPGVHLNLGQYAELLLGYLVQNRLVEAKFCWMRASAKDPLKAIWEQLGKPMAHGRHEAALQFARQLQLPSKYVALQPYVDELQKRLLAGQLQLVARCYSSVSRESLATILGLLQPQQQQLTELLAQLEWVQDHQGFITPDAGSDGLKRLLASLVNEPRFGPLQQPLQDGQWPEGLLEGGNGGIRGELRQLAQACAFFDRSAAAAATSAASAGGGRKKIGGGGLFGGAAMSRKLRQAKVSSAADND